MIKRLKNVYFELKKLVEKLEKKSFFDAPINLKKNLYLLKMYYPYGLVIMF